MTACGTWEQIGELWQTVDEHSGFGGGFPVVVHTFARPACGRFGRCAPQRERDALFEMVRNRVAWPGSWKVPQ
jgi:hypothetical protein